MKNSIHTLWFTYNDKAYAALVEERTNDGREFRITIMNGELEQQFYGENIIREKECRINAKRMYPSDDANNNLRTAIIQAINKNLLQRKVPF